LACVHLPTAKMSSRLLLSHEWDRMRTDPEAPMLEVFLWCQKQQFKIS
jgi:hypothetical protein